MLFFLTVCERSESADQENYFLKFKFKFESIVKNNLQNELKIYL